MNIWIDLSKYDGTVRKHLSIAVQKHAFDMGIYWFCDDIRFRHGDKPYIILFKDYDAPRLLYGDEYSNDDELISVDKFLDMKTSPFTQNTEKQNNIIYADFSWVKGEARSVLINKCINKAVDKGFVRIQYLTEKDNFCFKNNSIINTSLPYVCMNKSSKHIFTSENIPKKGREIKCNNMLKGKYQENK
jgi:hypothetical protein